MRASIEAMQNAARHFGCINGNRSVQSNRFKAIFGLSLINCVLLWDLCDWEDPLDDIKELPYFLLTLFFMRHYPTTSVMAFIIQREPNTVTYWIWLWMGRLAALSDNLVSRVRPFTIYLKINKPVFAAAHIINNRQHIDFNSDLDQMGEQVHEQQWEQMSYHGGWNRLSHSGTS